MKKIITLSLILCLLSLTALAEIYYVTAKSLNVRSGIGSQNPIVGKLTQGQQVDVKNQKNGWSQVDGGWVASSFLSKSKVNELQSQGKDILLLCKCESIHIVKHKSYARYDSDDEEYDEPCNNNAFTLNFTKMLSEAENYKNNAIDIRDKNGTLSIKSNFWDSGNIVNISKSKTKYKEKGIMYPQNNSHSFREMNRLTGRLRTENGTDYWKTGDVGHGIYKMIEYTCKKAPERKF